MPTRRELLWGAAGAAGALAAAAVGRAGRAALHAGRRAPEAARAAGHAPYGHGIEPPDALGPSALDAVTVPPPPAPGPVTRTLTIAQQRVPVARDLVLDAWTFDGGIPGPVLRVTEGESLTLRVRNLTPHPHNLHTHGAHAPTQDGWEPIAPGATREYVLAPRPFGLYPYHCDLTPGVEHLGRGLHGLLIVDPPQGRPAAQERVLLLAGFDTDGDGRAEAYGWNGVAGFHARHPLKVRRSERVRLYVANLVLDAPVATFHLHAHTFDVFPSGTSLVPAAHSDVVALSLGERAVLETTFEAAGRYMFHPHQPRLAEAGAMGWIAVT